MPELIFVKRTSQLRSFRNNSVAPSSFINRLPPFSLDEQDCLGIKEPICRPLPAPMKKPCRPLKIEPFKPILADIAEEKEITAVDESAAARSKEIAEDFNIFFRGIGRVLYEDLFCAAKFLKKKEPKQYADYAPVFRNTLKSYEAFEDKINYFFNEISSIHELSDCNIPCCTFFSRLFSNEKINVNSATNQFIEKLLSMNFQLDFETAKQVKKIVHEMVQSNENTVTPR